MSTQRFRMGRLDHVHVRVPDRTFVVPNGLDLPRFDALMAKPLEGPLPEGRPLVAVPVSPADLHRLGAVEARPPSGTPLRTAASKMLTRRPASRPSRSPISRLGTLSAQVMET